MCWSRFKVESQLVAMLQKYDTDIGDRQAQLEEMTAAFEDEKEQMIKLQVINVIYFNLL